jgi:hypothetical protein
VHLRLSAAKNKAPFGQIKKQREGLYSLTLNGISFYNFLYNEKTKPLKGSF